MTNKASKKGVNSQETLQQRSEDALTIADKLGWISAPVIAWAFWPDKDNRRAYAERLIAHLVKKQKWFTPHAMPFRQPKCYTATWQGRRYAKLALSFEMDKGHVAYAATYQHDTRAASALLYLADGNLNRVIFDREIKAANKANEKTGIKRPDGILLNEHDGRFGYWIEVENKAKTGPKMRKQVAEMIKISMATSIEDKLIHRLNTPAGEVTPMSMTYLIVPEGYNMEAFCNRVEQQIKHNDRDEHVEFEFVEDTKDGFKNRGLNTIQNSALWD